MNSGIWQYLSPDNPIAATIVGILKFVFILWCLGLIGSGLWLWAKRRQMDKYEGVETLVKARQKRTVGEGESGQKVNSEDKSSTQKVNPFEPTLLKEFVQPIQNQQTPIRQEPQPPKIQNLIRTKESPLQTFCRFYNVAIEDSNRRGEFMQRYQPIRIGVANVLERRRDANTEPVFQTSPYGDYYAVAIEENTLYTVVPRFDLTFQKSIYGSGAMGWVFDCPNYNPQLRYRIVKVVKPAFFEPDATKQHWTFKEKGELDLGQGE